MGFVDKLFGGKKSKQPAAVLEPPPCPHAVLLARWDSVEDMGIGDRATRFMCEACHAEFMPEVARAMRQGSVAERLIGQEEAGQA